MAEATGDTSVRSALPSRRGVTRPGIRALAYAVFAVALGAWIVRFGIPSDTVQIFLWLWLATICWNVEEEWRYHLNFVRDWWIPVAALVVYFYSRGLADELLKMPVHIRMPVQADQALFGELPSYWLQERMCGSPCDPDSPARWYDIALAVVYTSHFVAGLILAMVLWLRNRGEWKKWMRRYVGANLVALVIYILYPMAPPWMASEDGYLEHPVFRITHRGWEAVGLGRFHLVLTGVGNPVAAMPSLHFGISFLIAVYAIIRLRSGLRWLLLAYPATMGLALVYFGEHYVIDIICGAVLAGFVLAVCAWWERSRDTLDRAARDGLDRAEHESVDEAAPLQ
ncbi:MULTISPECIES: phosphatase PAP2 family protein [unclassified Nocardioides]|uniref:phosphatase PAP2 family protein n=1 Tax=unclassified Nocardioides TaxID=2615069 RepID=UPI0009EB9173|nr:MULTISPECIES: phosphatase PAP2 family protein [unclassified Nocardioides]